MDESQRGKGGSRRVKHYDDDEIIEIRRAAAARRSRSRSAGYPVDASRHHRDREYPERRRTRSQRHHDDVRLEDRQHYRRKRSRSAGRSLERLPHRSRSPRSRTRSSSRSDSVARHRKRKQKRKRRSKKRREKRHDKRSPSASSSSSAHRRAGVVSNDDDEESGGRKPRGDHKHGGASPHRRKDSPPKQSSKKKNRRDDKREDSYSRDDTVGHFHGDKGTMISDRFKVIRQVGLGTFGRVLECLDTKRTDPPKNPDVAQFGGEMAFVAIKMVRKIKRYREAALVEARIIQNINRKGGRGLSHCVRLRDAFDCSGHYCLVFESLGPSLHDFLKKNKFKGFPMVCLQDFAVQLLEALDFLHSMKIIHTDLKIENVLLVSDKTIDFEGQKVPESTRLKLIDFGGSCYDSEKKSSVINTRQYRAPEVMLGTGWSMPSDIWSLGCIFVELYQGELLFGTHDDVEHLALIERMIGLFPRWMIHEAKRGKQYVLADEAFSSDGYHRLDRVLSPDSFEYVRTSKSLGRIIKYYEDEWFLELVRRMLVIDPEHRARADDCLKFLARRGRDKVCAK